MPKNTSAKKPGPTGRLTAAVRDCLDKRMSQSEARAYLMDKYKTSEAVAKTTVSHIYSLHKSAPGKSLSPK